MKKIIINGAFLIKNINGVHRFAREIVNELDKINNGIEFEILVPKNYNLDLPKYENIKIIKRKKYNFFWQYFYFGHYVKRKKSLGLCLCSSGTFINTKNIITTIHDIIPLIEKDDSLSIKDKLVKKWIHFKWYHAIKFGKMILTVSEYSKKSIIEKFNANSLSIIVINNAWQHFKEVRINENTLKKYDLKKFQYYFLIGAHSQSKNMKWVFNVAKINVDEIFIISGHNYHIDYFNQENVTNVRYIGCISDIELKSLLKYCKAFIFPSIHEGFGILPLEALSVGVPIIISNSSCLPEIYGSSAHYINPYDYNIKLSELLKKTVESPKKILNKYNWKISAEKLYNLLKTL